MKTFTIFALIGTILLLLGIIFADPTPLEMGECGTGEGDYQPCNEQRYDDMELPTT